MSQAQPPSRATQISVVFAPRSQAVLSAEVSGVVVEIVREFGQTFEPKTPLVRLDPTVYKANYGQAAAALEAARAASASAEVLYKDKTVLKKAQAVLSAAKADYEAKEKLYAGRSTSLRELEASRRELNVAAANQEIARLTSLPEYEETRKNLALAQARFKIAEKDLEGCQVTAPFKGRVEKVLVNQSELVERGRPLIQVIDDGVLRAKFLAPSVAVQAVKPGMTVGIDVNELGRRVTGRVTHVSAVLDPASGTFEVYAEVDNPTGAIKSGMTGQVDPSSLKN
jgi:multidrug efflux system membrane fusion protein